MSLTSTVGLPIDFKVHCTDHYGAWYLQSHFVTDSASGMERSQIIEGDSAGDHVHFVLSIALNYAVGEVIGTIY